MFIFLIMSSIYYSKILYELFRLIPGYFGDIINKDEGSSIK